MRNTISKRILSAVTVFALVLSLFAWNATDIPAAYAEDGLIITETAETQTPDAPVAETGEEAAETPIAESGEEPVEAPVTEAIEEPAEAPVEEVIERPEGVETPAELEAKATMTAPEPGPVTIGPGYHVDAGGTYQIDSTAANGTIYIDVSDAVTLVGSWTGQTGTANSNLTIDAGRSGGANLTIQNLWISSPYNYGNVINFVGTGNALTASGTNILESQGQYNDAVVHVDHDTALSIEGDATSNLYVYKSGLSAAIGGNSYESCGVINFNGGNVFVKGTQQGAVIGGDGSTYTNGDITVNGGQLTIEANATGAGIGDSNQGDCAGNVIINGGSTLINVNADGSAIGYGADGAGYVNPGTLYMAGGSLEVYVNNNSLAIQTWGDPGPNEKPITARKIYGDPPATVQAALAAVDLHLDPPVDPSAQITVEVTPAGGTSFTAYDEVGLNQNDYVGTSTTTYTPSNWQTNADNQTLYLYLPISSRDGFINVDIGSGTTLQYSYQYNGVDFDVSPEPPRTVTFSAPNATVYVNGAAVSSASVLIGGTLNFAVIPDSGYVVTGYSTTSGTIDPVSNGVYTLSGVTVDCTVSMTTGAGTSYAVDFTDSAGTSTTLLMPSGIPVTNLSVLPGDPPLVFRVVPQDGYGVSTVTASAGTLTYDYTDDTYSLTNVTSDVDVTTVSTNVFRTVTFTPSPASAYFVTTNVVTGEDVTTGTSVPNGGTLYFSAEPGVGYAATVSSGGTVLTPVNGVYTLSGVTADTALTVAVTYDSASWTNPSYASAWSSGSGTAADPYIIASEANLAYLLQRVNGGTGYSNTYFLLTADLDLSAHAWAPIGGNRKMANSLFADGTPSFAGVFDGGNHAVSNFNINPQYFTDNFGGYGLFGYIDGGTLQNILAIGNISFTNDVSAVGGVVGYTTGSIYNVESRSSVYVDSENASEIGGVAGIVRDTGGAVSYVQFSRNRADVAGRGRLGGVVGAVYTSRNGGVVVDQCYNNGGIKLFDYFERSYVGGVVGYCQGYIQNCYNTGGITYNVGTENYYYLGGVAGLLNGGGGVYASLSDSFNTGFIQSPPVVPGPVVVEALWAYDDGSAGVTVTNCVYLNNMTQDPLGATSTNVTAISAADMASAAAISPTRLSSDYYDAGNPNPTLKWQAQSGAIGPVYVDPAASGANPDGTVGNPYNNLAAAMGAMSLFRDTVYITSTLYSANLNTSAITQGTPNGRIVRAPGAVGDMFVLDDPATTPTLTVSAVIDGNRALGTAETGSIFNIAEAVTLVISDGAVLQNGATAGNGGAITVSEGTLEQSGGTITSNSATLSGGGVYVRSAGTANLYGGVITANTAANGGGVGSAGTLGLAGVTVSGNTATNGGGVSVDGGTTAATGGSVESNTANLYGGGVYVNGGTFTLPVASSALIESNTASTGGGAYVDVSGALTLAGGTVESNSADNGGGIASVGSLTVSGGLVTANSAGNGGGLYLNGGTNAMSSGSVTANNATNGAGIYFDGGTNTLSGGTVASNTATLAGGGVYANGGTNTLNGGTIGGSGSANTAPNGGGVYTNGGTTNIAASASDSVTVSYNTATVGGGGLYINTNGTVISGGTIANNTSPLGGGVYVGGGTEAVMTGGSVSNNTVTGASATAGYGAGVFIMENTAFTQSGGIISNNVSSQFGGGVAVRSLANALTDVGGVFTFSGGVISGNRASSGGGGILTFGNTNTGLNHSVISTVSIEGGTIGGTTSADENYSNIGGGVCIDVLGAGTMSGGNIIGNGARLGGGVYIIGSSSLPSVFTQTAGSIGGSGAGEGNSAITNGGGVAVLDGGEYNFEGGDVTGNTGATGGGVYTSDVFNMNAGTGTGTPIITGNTASSSGGGLYIAYGGVADIDSGSITVNNATTNGGGVYIASGGVLTQDGASITNNTTPGDGGAVYIASSTSSKYTIISGTISGNTATGLGAGIYADGTSEVYPIVINPTSGAVITFGTSDVIYLNGNNTRIDLLTALSSASVPSAIRVQVSNPATDRIVVRTPDNATATASVGSFRRTVPLNYAMAVSGANIIYNGTSLDDE
jgi:hypothetical protein